MIARNPTPHRTESQPDSPQAALHDRPPISNTTRKFVWWFSGVMVITAGTAFIFKLIEFFYTATTDGSDKLFSFLMPVLTYLIVAAGFSCLFMWALLGGQYRDVEGPKYRMLEMQDEIDRHDRGLV